MAVQETSCILFLLLYSSQCRKTRAKSLVFPCKHNYFLYSNLENGVALFVRSEKSTFPFYFGSEMSEKTSEKFDFRANWKNISV